MDLTIQQLIPILKEFFKLPSEDAAIVAPLSFETDLDADSLDMVELVMRVEEEFDIEVKDEEYDTVLTVGDLALLINTVKEKKLQSAAPVPTQPETPAEPAWCPIRMADGRGPGSVFIVPENGDTFTNHGCSYCGSSSEEQFFAAIEAGEELGPTDKAYKVYIKAGGSAKFYFQHLSEEGRKRFIELLNNRQLKIGIPGHFYVLPFFCKPADKDG